MKNSQILLCMFIGLLGGCVSDQPLHDLTTFSTETKGDYLLFHFITPFTEEGYIAEVDVQGKVIRNVVVKDQHFAPSDVFYYGDNFYFTSGAYSNDSKVMKYNPKNRKLSLLDTQQDQFIEKYYKDDQSEYIINVIDKNDNNQVCDITLNKCIDFSEEYTAHTVTSLDNFVIIVGMSKNIGNTNGKNLSVKKYNRNLEELKEVTLTQIPNYFSYTSDDQKVYLFTKNGEILKIDSDLSVQAYPINLSSVAENIINVTFNNNVKIDSKRILVDMEIKEVDKKTDLLIQISFENDIPTVKVVQKGEDEDIVNVDYDSGEIFTRSYVEDKTVVFIRDIKTLDLTNQLTLSNKDPIYFVDNIK